LDGTVVDPDEGLTYGTTTEGVTVDPLTGEMTFTPTNDDAMAGEISVRITVTDARGATDDGEVTFVVLNVNDAPSDVSFTGVLPDARVETGKAYTLFGSATDVDDAAEDLTYTWYAGTRLVGHGREFVWRPKDAGSTVLRLVASDMAGDSTEFAIPVEVVEGSDVSLSGGTLLALVVLSAVVALAVGVYVGGRRDR
jgi:hypothetical protein